MALSAIGEGCHQQMESILNEIVSFVLLFCQDPVSIDQLAIKLLSLNIGFVIPLWMCLMSNCYTVLFLP